MRTDIPAFYSKWLDNRLKAGFVCVRNPYNKSQITRYLLDPKVVDCITFCTKNPAPILPYLDGELSKFRQFWFVTINGYESEYEPNVPALHKVIEAFKSISIRVGKNAIHWRYDPIFYGNGIDKQWHIERFTQIASMLRGYTDTCVISFLDLYEKVRLNAREIYPPSFDEQKELIKELVDVAKRNGITIRSCCEGAHLAKLGVDVSGCQTKEVLEKAIGVKLNIPKTKTTREACVCVLGHDIGAYNSCNHLCKYCYANTDKEIVTANVKQHNPDSPFLIGEYEPNDQIIDAKQVSFIDSQLTFF